MISESWWPIDSEFQPLRNQKITTVMLVDEDRLPNFGVVDFLVENGIGGVPDGMLDDFVGVSGLTASGGGRVDVVPALGQRSIANPENVLPKLARAMIEDIDQDGLTIPVADKISGMIR